MKDGHLNKCKTCTCSDSKKTEARIRSTPEGVESERARHREKYHRLGYREKQKEWDKNRPWKNSTKYKGLRAKFERKYGKREGFELHHWNYNKLGSVIILHSSTHRIIHSQLCIDDRTLCYKWRGILLDTKYKHQVAINVMTRENGLNRVVRGYELD